MASTSSNASDETARGRDQTRRETNTEPASENAPLLGLLGREPSSGPTEQSQPDREHSASGLLRRDPVPEDANTEPASENTPLLGRDTSPGVTEQSQPTREHSASGLLRALGGRSSRDGKGLKRRWPSLLALLLLCLVAALIMIFAFITPSIVEKYAQQALVFEPTSLSIDSFTADGVKARVQGDFMMDASKVEQKNVRNIGRLATWFAREVETGESDLEVSLPEYGNVVLGTADVPSIKVNIRNGHKTHIDFLSDLQPGDVDGIRRIAKDWIDGRLGQLRVLGKANVPLKSGLFSLGEQTIRQEITFANKDIPTMPKYKIQKLNFREVDIPSGKGMAADVALLVKNDYPVDFTIPPLGFGILVDNCKKDDPHIMIADALTRDIQIHPQQDVELNVTGNVRQLPDDFIKACPQTHESPLDSIIGKYMNGKDTTIYVQGSDSPSTDTPDWVSNLMKDITVPVSLPGRSFGSLIKNFTLEDTHFGLPDPFADPKKPESNPRISANIKAIVALPEEMNFNISVGRVRADADVFYKGKKLGKLDLHKWQKANSTRLPPDEDGPSLLVQSNINEAPLDITDDSVFTDVVQALIFGDKSVFLKIKALVDVETETALGAFAIRKIPAEGEVPVKPISQGGKGSGDAIDEKLRPKVFNLSIIDTTASSLTISALVNLTNPTNYSATVPFVDINILANNTLLGHATVKDLYVGPGNNTNIPVIAVWDPATLGGKQGAAVGREFLSQYISGWNTTLTLQTHNGTIPALPTLGHALSKFPVAFPTPRLGSSDPPPSDGDGDGGDDDDPPKKQGPHFIEDATFHLIGSSATFTLLSPLRTTTLYVTSINATAIYKHQPAGKILYDVPFAVPPVDEWGNGIVTPRLPVDWSFGSVGYDAVKRALGGSLKLGAEAVVGVRIGWWEQEIWFVGGGIGARVRL